MTDQLPTLRRTTDVTFTDRMPMQLNVSTPPTHVRSLVIWMLVVGVGLFGGLGSWAMLAHINSAVVAGGTFEVDGKLQVVQHLEGGLVKEIRVREGENVTQGEVIAVLDDTRVKAQIGILLNQMIGALSRDARLKAEFDEADDITITPKIAALVQAVPSFQEVVDAQIELFRSNRETDIGQVAILHERIAQMTEQQVGTENRLQALRNQLGLVQEELDGMTQLFKQGLMRKDRFVERQQDEAGLIGDIGLAESDLQEVYQRMAEVEQLILQVRRDRRQAIANERQQIKEQIYDLQQRLEAMNNTRERLVIRAPRAGQIVRLNLNTEGAVIDPGERILEIVPENSALVVEAKVSPSDIDEVIMGGSARVRLSAYSYRKTPPVHGIVTHVSADALFDRTLGESYYQVNVTIPAEELASMQDVKVVPGMPAQVMIATGEQTVIAYLLDPVLGGMETAMVENE